MSYREVNLLNNNMLDDLQQLYDEILLEYRVSPHQLSNMSLKQVYNECYEIFKDLGFTTASTFAIWDYIYRNLPDKIKTPEVQNAKKKHYGKFLREFVVNLINANMVKINLKNLKSKMLDRDLIKQYLDRNEYGNRRQGLLKKLSAESEREITRDY
jgi:hypothetical protein